MILGDNESNFVFINALHYRPMHIIPEKFTVKAHPALFEGKGSQKRWHYYSSLHLTYTFKTQKNHAKKH